MRLLKLNLQQGRVQLPVLGRVNGAEDLRQRDEQSELYVKFQADLASLKDTADSFRQIDNVSREAVQECRMVSVRREGTLAQLLLGDKQVQRCTEIPAVKDEDPTKGLVLSRQNEMGAQAFLDYDVSEFDVKKGDPLALPTGINSIVRNWEEPQPNQTRRWNNRISSEQSEEDSVVRYHFSDERVVDSDFQDRSSLFSERLSLKSDRRTIEIDQKSGTVTYTVDPDFGSRDVEYSLDPLPIFH